MNCPLCSQATFVTKTVGTERRRECSVCRHRFVTVEKLREEEKRQAEILEDARALAEKLVA